MENTEKTAAESALDNCDALIIGLGARSWVIVRRDGQQPVRALNPDRKRLRDLQVGDEVIYKNARTVVRSLAPFG